MDPTFWRERWQTRQIGFHQGHPHSSMTKFGARLLQRKQPHVLVPLCGKSQDLLWLAHSGALVTGAELVQDAVEEFFDEVGAEPMRQVHGTQQVLSDEELGVRVFVGDFFEVTPAATGSITGIYDRGALVALPPDLRSRYVEHLLHFLPPGGGILLVAMVYEQGLMNGPPFSVPRKEVEALFSSCSKIEQLSSESVIETEVRFRDRGLSDLWEEVYFIER
jgi:thiopurine S-methyltransferase